MVVGCQLFVICCRSMRICGWLLVVGCQSLIVGCRVSVVGRCFFFFVFVFGCWFASANCGCRMSAVVFVYLCYRLLVIDCLLLVSGCCLLVDGGWWLVVIVG